MEQGGCDPASLGGEPVERVPAGVQPPDLTGREQAGEPRGHTEQAEVAVARRHVMRVGGVAVPLQPGAPSRLGWSATTGMSSRASPRATWCTSAGVHRWSMASATSRMKSSPGRRTAPLPHRVGCSAARGWPSATGWRRTAPPARRARDRCAPATTGCRPRGSWRSTGTHRRRPGRRRPSARWPGREVLRGENPRLRPAQVLPQCSRGLLGSGKPAVVHVAHLHREELMHPGESPGGTLVRMHSYRSVGCTSRRRRFSVIRAEFSATNAGRASAPSGVSKHRNPSAFAIMSVGRPFR